MMKGNTGYIKSHTAVLFCDDEVQEIVAAIKSGKLPKTWATRRQHVAALKERFASDTICPKCGGELVLRTVKSGATAGSQFYGCAEFPACRFTKKLDTDQRQ